MFQRLIMAFEAELTGYDELIEAFDTMPERALPLAEVAMKKSCLAVEGILKEYPAETAANRPGRVDQKGNPRGYYERNTGSWWPTKRKLPKGKKGGRSLGLKKVGQVIYVLDPTSEQLGKSWSTEIEVKDGAILGIVGTDTSYAEDVQGTNQLALFAAIGWMKIDDAAEQAGPDIDSAWNEMLAQISF
jgi:hypothetical protein